MRTSLISSGLSRPAARAVAVAIILPCVLGVAAGVALAQVGSGWSQFQGGPAKAGAVLDGPAPAYRRAWRTPIEPGGPDGRFGLSVPIIAGEVAVAVGPEQVVGIDVVSGQQAFTVDRDLGPSVPAASASVGDGTAIVYTEGWGDGPPPVSPTEEASPTPSASPTPDGDPVDSHLAAFDLGTQEPSWPPVQLDAVSRTGVTVDGEMAFVGGNGGIVTAVDLADGTVAWTETLEAPLVTSIASADGQILVGLQGDRDTPPVLVSLDAASGEERWRHEPATPSAVVSAASTDGTLAYAIFTGPAETTVVALDLADGAERWSTRLNSAFDVITPPIVSSQAIVVVDPIGHVRALDRSSGEERWDFALNATTIGSVPSVIGGFLLVPTLEGELAAIDLEAGELAWRRSADGSPVRALAPSGSVLVAVRGGARAGMEAFEHDPEVALVSEASPTTLALGRMLGAMVIAVVPLLVLVLLLGRVLAARLGPAFDDDGDSDALEDRGDEPVRDPWEDEDPTP